MTLRMVRALTFAVVALLVLAAQPIGSQAAVAPTATILAPHDGEDFETQFLSPRWMSPDDDHGRHDDEDDDDCDGDSDHDDDDDSDDGDSGDDGGEGKDGGSVPVETGSWSAFKSSF